MRLMAKTPAEQKIAALIAPLVASMGYELVRVRISGAGTPVVQIMAEGAGGAMPIEGCEQVSRAVSAALDIDDPIAGAYTLEVSSPGIDRPLTREKDFETWAGQLAKVEMLSPIDGRKRFRGLLDGYQDGEVRIAVDVEGFSEPQVIGLPLADVRDAKLVLTDALIKQSQMPAAARPQAEPQDAHAPQDARNPKTSSEDIP